MCQWEWAIAILSTLVASAIAEAQYNVTDLGTLPGGFHSYAYGLNDLGQVVGASENRNGQYVAFLWTNGTLTNLGTLPGGTQSAATGINLSGQIVGWSDTTVPEYAVRGFLRTSGNMTALGTFGRQNSQAYGINDAGQVVGYADGDDGTGDSESFPFLYTTDGGLQQLATSIGQLGQEGGIANAINASGQIAAFVGYPSLESHASLYTSAVANPTDLGTLWRPTDRSNALAINKHGQIAGWSFAAPSGYNHAFLYTNGAMIDLGTFGGPQSQANGINDNGQVVGWSEVSPGQRRAFLYSNGSVVNLNTVLPPSSKWVLIEATAINNQGQIVGYGSYDGGFAHAVLLTPGAAGENWTFNWPQPNSPWTRVDNVFSETSEGCTWTFTSLGLGSSEIIQGDIVCADQVTRSGIAMISNGSLQGLIIQRRFPPVIRLSGTQQTLTARARSEASPTKAATQLPGGSSPAQRP